MGQNQQTASKTNWLANAFSFSDNRAMNHSHRMTDCYASEYMGTYVIRKWRKKLTHTRTTNTHSRFSYSLRCDCFVTFDWFSFIVLLFFPALWGHSVTSVSSIEAPMHQFSVQLWSKSGTVHGKKRRGKSVLYITKHENNIFCIFQ